MGILNLTDDSFYEGSRATVLDDIVRRAEVMEKDGALIIDLGAMSSRPGAPISDPENELQILLPAIRMIKEHTDLVISVDTLHSSVASASIEEGAHIINDISAGEYDNKMLDVITEAKAGYIAMHMRGLPSNMQSLANYEEGVTQAVLAYFIERTQTLFNNGVHNVIIDPGFGFAKTVAHNYQLLKEMGVLRILEVPILVGISRKSMIWRTIEGTPDNALAGTNFLHSFSLQNGANILRVHDVKEAADCIKIWNAYCG